jgi:hypothetical protein
MLRSAISDLFTVQYENVGYKRHPGGGIGLSILNLIGINERAISAALLQFRRAGEPHRVRLKG